MMRSTLAHTQRFTMSIVLSPNEARVIACLLEKEITTPEQYPLSLNSLTNACNQKSNRDPVLELDEATVQQTLDDLVRKRLVSDQTGYGSRVTKYQHRFCNTEFGNLRFTPQELGIVCELLLRGPQTPGELRSRASRLCKLNDVSDVDAVLRQLSVREDGPFVVRLAREPGKRESRYAQLFCGEVEGGVDDEHAEYATVTSVRTDRIAELESRVAALEAEVVAFKAFMATFE
jgi:uncharacterized protein YceH (UPF0502 family)